MILQCPECTARYLVPDSSVRSPGRQVRCAKCHHSWFCKPASREDNKTLGELDKLLNEINARPDTGLAKGANLPALRGLASRTQKLKTLSVAAIVAVLVATNFSPQWLGIPPSKGLMLTDVGFLKIGEGEEKNYQITGRITNTSGRIIPAPTLRITLVDDEGASLQYWEYGDTTQQIGPWNKIPFDSGPLEVRFQRGSRFVVEIGSSLELALRRKPPAMPPSAQPEPAKEG